MRRASLTLVGDPNQLPPVRPGQPVADALAEGMLPCIDLRQIYRTAANSAIVTSAHAINRGTKHCACMLPFLPVCWPGHVVERLWSRWRVSAEQHCCRHLLGVPSPMPGTI